MRSSPCTGSLDAGRQVYNYLPATSLEVGLLLHFGREANFYRLVFENARKRDIGCTRGPTNGLCPALLPNIVDASGGWNPDVRGVSGGKRTIPARTNARFKPAFDSIRHSHCQGPRWPARAAVTTIIPARRARSHARRAVPPRPSATSALLRDPTTRTIPGAAHIARCARTSYPPGNPSVEYARVRRR